MTQWARRALETFQRRCPVGGEDGAAGAVELVLLTPLVIALTFGTIQVGLWMHGRNLVTAAAQEAARTAAVADLDAAGGAGRGEQAARAFLADQDVVEVGAVSVQRGTETVTAVVTGTGLTMLPAVDLRVTGRARASVERFVAP